MNKIAYALTAMVVALTGCTHKVDVGDITVRKVRVGGPTQPTIAERQNIAHQTCEAQYNPGRQNYLSAIQAVIAARGGPPNGNIVPLNQFRAEINAAYNTVVMRCKTHTNCLEVKLYDEASCYMSASDRKDAERRFSDLSQRLREIEREYDKKRVRAGAKKPGIRVTVDTDVSQTNEQTNDTHVGDRIEDQDVLVLCGDAGNLLDRKCRQACGAGRC